ncbi:YsnF/AvaK domain-containing protein [Belnapia sp. T18]|uniref:YsnF/AvaK domain-containing protein n=1 Tax=Belnapia arida TaxID=2804533 RepID=A0ABS1TWF9_9PROT|nr:YsnF/AvaK domain-containing protein [Belnapia arida]MBL6076773.1 YsnF/AvaK domain-containing protein [Belnapia arida]
MSNRTITAVFDSAAEADAASRDLATKVGGVRAAVFTNANQTSEFDQLGIAGPDRSVLEEAMRRGSVVLSATVPEDRFAAAADVIESSGAIDLDSREAEWRGAGWSEDNIAESGSMTTATAPATPQQATMGRADLAANAGTPTAATITTTGMTGGMATGASTGATGLAAGREESIPIVEERLRVGKRETTHGRVRIRSYVVETPVQEQVTLHQEHVQVDRRPVDRPVEVGADAFRERTIEATETAEEAVIAKEARVKEEVVIRKTADDETRTVQDTVRRTEVEIEDDRQVGARGTGTTTGTTTDTTTGTPRNPTR